MDRIRRHSVIGDIRYFIKWSILSVIIGGLIGSVGAIFAYLVNFATKFWMSNTYSIFILPFSGLFIMWFYHILHADKPRGTNLVLDSIAEGDDITINMAPLIFVSTVLTHIGGGSSGREGAALQLGGSLGNLFGKCLKLDRKDRNIAIMCGMSACFAAVFGTPLAAAIFAMEVISIGIMHYSALIPGLFSAYIAAAIAKQFGVTGESFILTNIPDWNFKAALLIILLGIFCAFISSFFCILLHKSDEVYKKYFKNPYIRILAASLIFIALTLLLGSDDYRGGGFQLVEKCMEGEVRYEAFLLKMFFTALLLGAGFKGGEIVPTFTVGATFGCMFGIFLGLSPQLCTACGMAACFAGVTNCPISSIFIAIELFGIAGLPYYALAIAVSFCLSGYNGLYSAQRFTYSKSKPEYINAKLAYLHHKEDEK